MGTTKQIESARRNGRKSRGPKTPEGKEKSSMNALKHGLRSEKLYVLRNETEDNLRALFDACIGKFNPSDAFEFELVSEIAYARWRMRRFWTIEAALLDDTMETQAPKLAEEFEHLDEQTRLARAFADLSDNHRAIHLLPRYEAHVRRNFDRAVTNMLRLRAAAGPPAPAATGAPAPSTEKLPNEPDSLLPEAA
jgi:hypothetical protein